MIVIMSCIIFPIWHRKPFPFFVNSQCITTLRYIKETDLAPINLGQLFFDLHTVPVILILSEIKQGCCCVKSYPLSALLP